MTADMKMRLKKTKRMMKEEGTPVTFGKRFDFVFSIGEDCGCAMNLRRFGLRIMSSPFDWVNSASFGTRIDLLCKAFDGFCDRESLVFEPQNPNVTPFVAHHDTYFDKRFGFRFIHDFDKDVPLDESYPRVREKYDRRIARTLGKIRQSRHVLAVWWSRDKIVPTEEIAEAVDRLRKTFPNSDMNLMVCQNAPKRGRSLSFERIGDSGLRVLSCFAPDPDKTDGDERANRALFRRIRVSRGIRLIQLKRMTVAGLSKFCGLWHFSRDKRKAARSKYKERMEIWMQTFARWRSRRGATRAAR